MTPQIIPPAISPPVISVAEFAERRRRAAALASGDGLAGLLVCSRGGGTLDRFGDVYYLTNYYTSFPFIPDLPGAWTARAHAFAVLSASGACLLVTDAPNDGCTMLPADQVIYTDDVLEGTLDAMARLGLDTGAVGLVGSDVLPVKTYWGLKERLPEVVWHDAQAILVRLRAVKSPAEIELLRRASQVGSRAIEAMM